MGTKTPVRVKKVYPAEFKVLDEAEGIYEQWVSVFNVVDYIKDKVLPSFFDKNLAEWKASGDPIPVIFAHQWDDLDAYVGETLEAEAMKPGDERLPEKIREFGALYTKNQLDLQDAKAAKLFRLLKRRLIKEASFSYEVDEERRAKGGINELVEGKIIEQGPCLKGMNPMTQLGEVKSAEPLKVRPKDPEQAKAWVVLAGSMEERQMAVYEAVCSWTSKTLGNGGWPGLEATFDDRVVFWVESYSEGSWDEAYYQASYTVEPDGAITLGDPAEVEIQATIAFKSRRKAGRVLSAKNEGSLRDARDLVDGVLSQLDEQATGTEAKDEEPERVKSEEPKAHSSVTLFEAEVEGLAAL